MKAPLVSIITPCFNGENYLDRYFESILNQTYPNIELIFVNDGSTDKTEEIALSYQQKLEDRNIKFIYIYQKNAGQAAALNKGLKIFKGDYLTWPDSDDTMTPDCIEKKVKFLQEHPQYKFCVCNVNAINETDNQLLFIYENKRIDDTFFEDLLYVRNVFFTPVAYMVESKALLQVIHKRAIYTGRGGQNVQILLPMSYNYQCGYIDEVLCNYYVRGNSHSHSINDSLKVIHQIELYEKILLETLKRINDDVFNKYQLSIRCFYGKQKFGNAIDSKNKKLIKKYYMQLRENCKFEIRSWLLYKKYTFFGRNLF